MLAMILAAALVQAATAAPETAKSVEAAKPEKAKKICVEEQQMGSHFKRRICATAEEWEKRRERDAKVLDRGANVPVK